MPQPPNDPWARPTRYQPPPPPPVPPPKRRSAAPLILAALLTVAVVLGGAYTLTRLGEGAQTASDATTATPQPAAKLGQVARDGQLQFTVRRIDCTKRRIGGEFGETAQGVFCQVHLRVTNVGDEPRTFTSASQYAYDTHGRKFATDTGAAIHLDESNSFLEDINPGNAVDGIVVFDVPRGTKLTRVELHDSAFSGGVAVSLTK